MPSPRIVLYERAGCHLCEEVALELDRLIGPDGYERVDIEADDDLLVRYGHRIPVIAVDCVDRLEVPISAPDLRELLGSLPGRPVGCHPPTTRGGVARRAAGDQPRDSTTDRAT